MPIIRVVLVGQSREAVVTAQRPVRGDRLITSSACRWTMGPGRRSVQLDHRRTPKAAVPWGGSFCFPLMAPLSSQLRPGRDPISRFLFPSCVGEEKALHKDYLVWKLAVKKKARQPSPFIRSVLLCSLSDSLFVGLHFPMVAWERLAFPTRSPSCRHFPFPTSHFHPTPFDNM